MKTYKLAPSLLAADFTRLAECIGHVHRAGAHYLHLDIMDGLFVNNISFGLPVVKSIRKTTDMVFDTHLMITDPARYIGAFAEAGADIINVHYEACPDLTRTLRDIRALHKSPAVTIKPDTEAEAVFDALPEADMVLVMSVEPGFGGQRFLPHTLKTAERLANFIAVEGLHTDIEIDGGINLQNAADVLSAGVNVLVCGSSVFGADDIQAAVKDFYALFGQNQKS